MLEQAVSNLTYNAIRYNRPEGHVAVLLERVHDGARTEPGRFRLTVLDDGPGVDPALLGRLLERGLRTDAARARAPEGKGLGLSIAQRVVELHQFELALERPTEGGFQATLKGALQA
jgi:signal transduction histidine kinase